MRRENTNPIFKIFFGTLIDSISIFFIFPNAFLLLDNIFYLLFKFNVFTKTVSNALL